MIKEMQWNFSFEEDNITTIIRDNPSLFKDAGGSIETFISKIKMLHSKRVFSLGLEHKFILTEDDLQNTIEYMKKNVKTIESELPYPHMYI